MPESSLPVKPPATGTARPRRSPDARLNTLPRAAQGGGIIRKSPPNHPQAIERNSARRHEHGAAKVGKKTGTENHRNEKSPDLGGGEAVHDSPVVGGRRGRREPAPRSVADPVSRRS